MIRLWPLLLLLLVAAEPARSPRVLMFVSHDCIPCRLAIRETEDWMRPSGWTFGPTADNHVQTLNVDTHPDLVERFKVEINPTFVLLVDGVETKRAVGYKTSQPVEVRRRVIVELFGR